MALTANMDKMADDTPDRILSISTIEGVTPTSSTGLVDSRLFKGGNKLHALRDDNGNLWRLKYEQGDLPGALKQRFTSFPKLLQFVENYFERRGLRVTKED